MSESWAQFIHEGPVAPHGQYMLSLATVLFPSPTAVLHDAAPFINPGKSGCHGTVAEIIVTAQNIP